MLSLFVFCVVPCRGWLLSSGSLWWVIRLMLWGVRRSWCVFVCLHPFFVDFPVSGVVRAKPQKVKSWCKCKIARWYASKIFPMEFLVRELVLDSRLFVRTKRFSTSYSPVTMRAVSRLTLSSSACAPVLIFWTDISVFICLLRAKVLSLNPKVDSPRFEARSGKNSASSPNVRVVRAKVQKVKLHLC